MAETASPPSSPPSARTSFQERIGVGERQYGYGRHVGTDKTTPVSHEVTGRIGGYQTEHWSGQVDATVLAPTLKLKAQTSEM